MKKLIGIIVVLSLLFVVGCSYDDVVYGTENTNAITGNAVADVGNDAIVAEEAVEVNEEGPALDSPRIAFG